MHRYVPFFLIGLSTTLLAGCSSTGGAGGGGGGGTPSSAVFAASAGTASEALADGETLMAYNSLMSAAVEHDFDAGETRALDDTIFSIAANDQGALDVTIDGVTHSFAAADIGGNGLEFEPVPGGAQRPTFNEASMEYGSSGEFSVRTASPSEASNCM